MGGSAISKEEEEEDNKREDDSRRLYHVEMNINSMVNIKEYFVVNYPHIYQSINFFVESCQVVSVINNDCDTALLVMMYDQVMETKSDQCEVISPDHNNDPHEFIMFREQSGVLGLNYTLDRVSQCVASDPNNVFIHAYRMCVYMDYVLLTVISNVSHIYDLHQWFVLGFFIPLRVWRRLYPHLFDKKNPDLLKKVVIRSLSETCINEEKTNPLWEYKSILFIRPV